MKVFKKILFIMLIISTVSFSISLEEYRSDNNPDVVEISEGWNLISLYDLIAINHNDCVEGIENSFFLPNGKNRYVSISKLSEGDNSNTISSGYFDVHLNGQEVSTGTNELFLDKSFWYKSPNTVDCDNRFYSSLLENKDSLTYKDTLKQGWSMIAISTEMAGNKIGDVFGSCNLRKLLGYENNQWVTLEFDNDYTIKESDISKPFFVGLRNDCDIDITSDNVVSYDIKEIGNEIGRDNYFIDYRIHVFNINENIGIQGANLEFDDGVVKISDSSPAIVLVSELKDIDDEYYYDLSQAYPNTYIRLIDINEIDGISYAVVVSYT